MPMPTSSAPAGRRHRNQLTGALALVVAALVMFTLGPGRGLLVLGLSWVLVRFLASHRDGGRRQWSRALVEYATVAALVVAVMTAAPAPDPPKAKPKPRSAAADQADPLGDLRARWDKLIDRVSAEAPVIHFPADPPNGGR
jgi:hypothetical protein